MKKIAAIVGGIILLVMLFTAPWVALALIGLIGGVISLRKFFYYRGQRQPDKAKTSAIVLGVSVAAFAIGGYLMPSTTPEKETASESKQRTTQTTKKEVQESSKQEEITLGLSETVETDGAGTITIKGTTEPHTTVYLASESSDKGVEADSDGNFELNYALTTDTEKTIEVIAERDGQKITKQITAKPSTAFIAAKKAEADKKAEELRIAQEAEQKQAEIERLTKEAEAVVAQAEANQTRENVVAASTAIAAIPEGNQSLSTRVSAVDTAIHAREEQAAQQAAAAAEAEQAAQQAQNDVTQMVLVTPTGSKYHNRKCGNGTYTEDTLDAATSRGLTPCSKCF